MFFSTKIEFVITVNAVQMGLKKRTTQKKIKTIKKIKTNCPKFMILKGVFAKNEMGHRLNAIKKRF